MPHPTARRFLAGLGLLATTALAHAAAFDGPVEAEADADPARNGDCAAVAHLVFPGIGQSRAGGKGYRWPPANYATK